MFTRLTHLTVLVADQDEALAFYARKLGFKLHTDAMMPNGYRWLTVCPSDAVEFELALMPAIDDNQKSLIGNQAGAEPFFVLETKDCKKTIEELKANGVEIVQDVTEEAWGTGASIKDLYGNIIYINQAM